MIKVSVLAYLATVISYTCKWLMILASVACIIKLITAVINSFRSKLECLSLASLSSLEYCLGKTLQLITETVNYSCNKFYDAGSGLSS